MMKKIVLLGVGAAMMVGMGTTVYAADGYTIALIPQQVGIPYFETSNVWGAKAGEDLGKRRQRMPPKRGLASDKHAAQRREQHGKLPADHMQPRADSATEAVAYPNVHRAQLPPQIPQETGKTHQHIHAERIVPAIQAAARALLVPLLFRHTGASFLYKAIFEKVTNL